MTAIQSLDQALAHLGVNDPMRPQACKTLLEYMMHSTTRARFASWSYGGVEHDEVVSRLLESWVRRGRPIYVKHSAEGIVLRSLKNAFAALKRERSRQNQDTISLDDEDTFVQVASNVLLETPDTLELLEAMPTLGKMLPMPDVDALLERFFLERIVPLCSRRTQETTRRFIQDRVALTLGTLTLTEACAAFSSLPLDAHSPDALATARNTYHQNAVRSRARLDAVLSGARSRHALELTEDELLALRRWALGMGLISA